MNIGQAVRELRKKRGLTMKQLAIKAQVDPATVWKLEIGKRLPSTHILSDIVNALEAELIIKEKEGVEHG